MAVFLLPAHMQTLTPTLGAIVSRLWEVECLGTLDDDDLSA